MRLTQQQTEQIFEMCAKLTPVREIAQAMNIPAKNVYIAMKKGCTGRDEILHRESLEMFDLIVAGKTYKEIAAMFGVSHAVVVCRMRALKNTSCVIRS